MRLFLFPKAGPSQEEEAEVEEEEEGENESPQTSKGKKKEGRTLVGMEKLTNVSNRMCFQT